MRGEACANRTIYSHSRLFQSQTILGLSNGGSIGPYKVLSTTIISPLPARIIKSGLELQFQCLASRLVIRIFRCVAVRPHVMCKGYHVGTWNSSACFWGVICLYGPIVWCCSACAELGAGTSCRAPMIHYEAPYILTICCASVTLCRVDSALDADVNWTCSLMQCSVDQSLLDMSLDGHDQTPNHVGCHDEHVYI